MSKPLLWKLCLSLAAGAVLLFWLVNLVTLHAEQRMSFIAPEHQRTLLQYGHQAEALFLAGDMAALEAWLQELQHKEQTWAALVRSRVEPLAGSSLSSQFVESFRLGRNLTWKIHLYFKENPILDITFADRHTHFLITLPQHMRPGAYLHYVNLLLQIALPLCLLLILCLAFYRHVMHPLRNLELATRKFSEGNFHVRVRHGLGARNDELAALAETFDRMAERTSHIILTQRQLIADLSHELRTPLTRIDMAVDCVERGIQPQTTLTRIRRESAAMRKLVEDTLTLAWLENEKPLLQDDSLDLVDLIDSILDDARFEYPDRQLMPFLPAQAPLEQSSQRALGQAIENILRNGLRHTPPGGTVQVALQTQGETYLLTILDQGEGVPKQHLQNIFKPFFRIEKTRERSRGGFGLGLSLAQRQVESVGGTIWAEDGAEGLCIHIRLPRPQASICNSCKSGSLLHSSK